MSEANVNCIAYDERNNLLTVEYGGGHRVVYQPVNPESYTEVLKSDCFNRAIHKLVRQPQVVGIRQQRGH
jgi:hypothetical protein